MRRLALLTTREVTHKSADQVHNGRMDDSASQDASTELDDADLSEVAGGFILMCPCGYMTGNSGLLNAHKGQCASAG